MNKSFNTDYISKLVDTYIFEKQNAYYNYEIFASLTDEKKISFLLSINEKDYGSKLINTAIINTYLYPNDAILTVACGKSLNENVDKFLELTGLFKQIFEDKKIEFRFFQFMNLVGQGYFGQKMINQGTIYGDSLINYQNKQDKQNDKVKMLEIK